MPKKIIISKEYIVPSCSFIAIYLFILMPIVITEPNIAEWLFGITLFAGNVLFSCVKGLREALMDKWMRINCLVHWGIISIFFLSLFYYIFYFLKNFKIDFNIISRENNE